MMLLILKWIIYGILIFFGTSIVFIIWSTFSEAKQDRKNRKMMDDEIKRRYRE